MSFSEESIITGSHLSYGDSCLLNNGQDISNLANDCILDFNPLEKTITAQSGITFDDLLKFLIPRGFFLPVTPGTKFVTLGGAIANDVHGKNHHVAGSFGNHVLEFKLAKSDGTSLICSATENAEYFRATIGGLGLTGAIEWAKFKLLPIKSSSIDAEQIKFNSLDEFFAINSDSKKYTYTVAWLDCLNGQSGVRGIYIRGNHSEKNNELVTHNDPLISIPELTAMPLVNNLTSKIFNILYYNKQVGSSLSAIQHYEPFFYPLDAILNWNLFYGRPGFMQFQCMIPFENLKSFEKLMDLIRNSGQGSFLSVLKTFGDIESPGLLSFPEEGITLCLDFPHLGEKTNSLFRAMEDIVVKANGKMYPAKDQTMKPESFKQFYPNWEKILPYKDPNLSSSFWKRVMEEK